MIKVQRAFAQVQNQPQKSKEYAALSLALAKQHQLAELQKEVEVLLREIEGTK